MGKIRDINMYGSKIEDIRLEDNEIYEVQKDGLRSLLFVSEVECIRICITGCITHCTRDCYKKNFKILRKVTDKVKIIMEDE